MDPKELEKILLHDIPNGWSNQAYIQGWNFEGNAYKETYEMF